MQRWAYRKPDNLVELFENATEVFPHNPLFGTKTPDGSGLRWTTYKEVGNRVDDLRAGLASLGIGKNDVVGIISSNRPEWAIAAFASYGREAIFVPMYEAELPKVWEHIIKDSAIKVLFVSKPDIYGKVRDFPKKIKSLEKSSLSRAKESKVCRSWS